MKATLRRNGKHMITVRTEHHLDRDELRALLLLALWPEVSSFGQNPEPRDVTRAEAEDGVRKELFYDGLHRLEFTGEHIGAETDESRDQADDWADRQIDRLWPDMKEEQ